MVKKISIIIPVYNAEEYIEICINSILRQSNSNFELILVNDGSTDKSLDICLKYMEIDNRIHVINKSNGGVSSARNEGIAFASNDYITFVDADDFVCEDYCEMLLSHVNNEVDYVAFGLFQYITDHQKKLIRHRLKSGYYTTDQIKQIVIDDGTMSGFTFQSSCAGLYKKEILSKYNIKFREDIKYNEDGLFNTNYMLHCKHKIYINFGHGIYCYRLNNKSATHIVDLTGTAYHNALIKVDKILHTLNDECDIQNFTEQMKGRHISLSLSKIRYIAKHKNDFRLINEIIYNNNFKEAIKAIKFSSLTAKKQAVYLLLKTQNGWLINKFLKHIN